LQETDSVRDVISGIVPSRGSSPLPSFAINSCKIERRQCNLRYGKPWQERNDCSKEDVTVSE
jgi:hypothetical protein